MPLQAQVSPNDLENLLLVAEMGGVIGRYQVEAFNRIRPLLASNLDSVSDKAMAEEFATDEKVKTMFVFVGDPRHTSEIEGDNYETIITGGKYDVDTAAYLAANA